MSKRHTLRWAGAALMACVSVMWLIPVAFTVLTAFKGKREFTFGSVFDFPQTFAIGDNISGAWQLGGLGEGFTNSLLYATVGAGCAVLCGSLAAYGIVHLRIRGGFVLFLLMFVGTLFPFQMLLIPLYQAYTKTGLYDTRLGLFIFYTAIAIPFCLFVLRNYFTTIPNEILEAAQIDGCSRLQAFVSIVLPMSKPPLYILFLTQFVWIWNDLLFGLTLSQSSDIRPVMAGVSSLSGTYGSGSVPELMAAALVVSIPATTLFFCFQRYYMQGMRLTTVGS